MKVLIEQGGHDFLNLGDLAMLQVTTERIRKRWPDAHMSVLTSCQSSLESHMIGMHSVTTAGRDALIIRDRLFTKVSPKLNNLDKRFWRSFPKLAEKLMMVKNHLSRRNLVEARKFSSTLKQADFVVASGGGYITDEFPGMVKGICGTIAMANRYGKPTAMFGQGLGPLNEPYLVELAREAISGLRVLGIREPIYAPEVARSLGASSDRIKVTGDDATALAFHSRREAIGDGVGFNVRVAGYSGVASAELSAIAFEMSQLSADTKAPMIPIVISLQEQDRAQSTALLPADGNTTVIPISTPAECIGAVSMCRIVITGSYHAAVFALGQGIPVIGLAKSPYYHAKFEGLKALYTTGMQVVDIAELKQPGSLSQQASELYKSAKDLRSLILEQSAEIVNRSEKLYADFFDTLSQ